MNKFRMMNISYRYPKKDQSILDGISLEIGSGELVALIGRSGSGKTTLAKLAAGYLAPTQGKIQAFGSDMTGRPNRRVIMVSQELDIFPWQKMRQAIGFAMLEKSENKIDELIRLFHLEGLEDHFPFELSGGQQKRLALARTLAADPRLLILDEPFGSWDYELKEELLPELKSIWKKTGKAVLLITHDPREAEMMADRRIRLSKDRPARII